MAPALKLKRRSPKQPTPRAEIPQLNLPNKAVIATDLTGKIVFWNSAAEHFYGWTWQEVIGRSVVELLVPASGQSDAATIMADLQKGKSWSGRFRLRRRDGSELSVTVTDQPMRDSNGNLIGIIGVSHPGTATD